MIDRSVQLEFRSRQGTWILVRGRETFYKDDILREWETREKAIEWLAENHPELYVSDEVLGI